MNAAANWLATRVPQDPLDPPISTTAGDVDRIWHIFLYIAYGVAALIVVLVVYAVIRFRKRSDELPEQKHYNIPIEVTYVVVPLFVVLGLFLLGLSTERALDKVNPKPDLVVHVVAFQWQWRFDYPASGVSVIGGPDNDIPELVLPANSSVRFDLESLDVIHSFWLTSLRFKRDIIPGSPSSFSVHIIDAPGTYPNAGVCAEYCGLDHAKMQFSVRILEPAQFTTWLNAHAATTKETVP